MNAGQNTDLRTVLTRSGPLDPARAVNVVRQIAAAIDDAHADQRIHRDITPTTILLSGDDYAYLTDIGTATATVDTAALTYRAPELVANSEMAYRADIYALTAVLYECLTGSPPYQSSTADATSLITAHLNEPTPHPSQLRAAIPAGFDDVIARGMAKNPADRYRSAAELAAAAHDALTTPPRHVPSNQPTRADTVTPGSTGATEMIRLPMPSAPTDPNQPPWVPAHVHGPPVTYPPLPPPHPRPKRRRRLAIALVAVLAVVAGVAAIVIPRMSHHTATATTPAQHSYSSQATVLPFPALDVPKAIAVDGTGNIYVLSSLAISPGQLDQSHKQLFKLAPGETSATTTDFPRIDVRMATDFVVDSAGNLYLSDGHGVWKSAAGGADPIRLPFRGFVTLETIAVDPAGNVYAAGSLSGPASDVSYGVKKLVPGDTRPTDLPFPDLHLPRALAVDKAGNVYAGDSLKGSGKGRVRKLAVNSTTPTELSFPGLLEASHMAIDAGGNLFVADTFTTGLYELKAGTTTSTKLPIPVRATTVAVDSAGNLYITTLARADKNDKATKSGQVLKVAPDK